MGVFWLERVGVVSEDGFFLWRIITTEVGDRTSEYFQRWRFSGGNYMIDEKLHMLKISINGRSTLCIEKNVECIYVHLSLRNY